MRVIEIPTTSTSVGSGFRSVLDTLECLGLGEFVTLDLSKSRFINPTALLPIVALKQSSPFADRIGVANDISAATRSYLSTICFPNPLATDQMSNDELSNVLEGYKYKSYVPIVSFAGGKEDLATQRRDMVISSIGELIYNSLDLFPVARSVNSKEEFYRRLGIE